jgi:prepilin-type N-terminal cleavage/methylation domain-containing protein/prepilin-type processing-associated H-X9-DG protein
MTVLSTRQVRRAFTLVELLVVIAIIGVLVALLLPALSSARAAANLSGSSSNLASFGRAFELYANDNNGSYTSGAFDHYRDGDIRQAGWVADVVKMKVASPGKSLDLGSRNKYNEKVGDYVGATKNKSAVATGNCPYWDERGLGGSIVTGLAGLKGENGLGDAALTAQEARELIPVYNSNYATTWHFSRGDPSATNGYTPGAKTPAAGDGGLTQNHIAQGRAPGARIAMMGPARAGDGSDALVIAGGTENSVTSGVGAAVFNLFAGKTLVKAGDLLVESFNDGMEVSAADAFGGGTAERIHGFNDIEPLHQAKNSDGSGGTAPILFADGHVAKILDTVTAGSTAVKKGDSFLGAGVSRNTTTGAITGFVIDNPSYNELADQVWLKRLRVLQTSAGTPNED